MPTFVLCVSVRWWTLDESLDQLGKCEIFDTKGSSTMLYITETNIYAMPKPAGSSAVLILEACLSTPTY